MKGHGDRSPSSVRVAVNGVHLRVLRWSTTADPGGFLLVHGLASNALTWRALGSGLNAGGLTVAAVDLRGHGESQDPGDGFDFHTVAADVAELVTVLKLAPAVVVGQSWGGNLALYLAAEAPELVRGLVLVDGGFLDLQAWLPDWADARTRLTPPVLAGTPLPELEARIRAAHPDWSEAGVEATLGNFEVLPDGTVRPRLGLDNHMAMLKALWDQRPVELMTRVEAPALLCVAAGREGDAGRHKADMVAQAESRLSRVRTEWFDDTDHDIHVHRPDRLAHLLVQAEAEGFWGPGAPADLLPRGC